MTVSFGSFEALVSIRMDSPSLSTWFWGPHINSCSIVVSSWGRDVLRHLYAL